LGKIYKTDFASQNLTKLENQWIPWILMYLSIFNVNGLFAMSYISWW